MSTYRDVINAVLQRRIRHPNDVTDAEIANGVIEVDSAYPFGDVRRYGATTGTANSTTAFTTAQAAVGTGGTITVIGTYRVTAFALLSNRRWDLRVGVIESFNPDTYLLKATEDIENVTFIGGLLDGRIAAAAASGSSKYGFWGAGCTNISFIDTVFDSFHEDGITLFEGVTVEGGGYRTPCRNIRFSNVWIRRCGRNGLSIINAKGVYGKVYCSESDDPHSFFIGPWAGVDIEPDNLNTVSDIDLDVVTWDNAGTGVGIYGLAVDVFEAGSVRIRHHSNADLRGFRFGRWVDRAAGEELSVQYDGVIRDPTSTDAIYIDTLGGNVSLDLKAQVYINDNAKFVATLLKEAPGGTYANTPRIRADIVAIGTVDDIFDADSVGQVMTSDAIFKIDATKLTFAAIGGQDNYAGHLEVLTTAINPAVNANTGDASVSGTNVVMGERIQTNTGASGDITLTLQSSFLTDQEAEFYVADSIGGIRIELQDTAKVIYPFGAERIFAGAVGSRIRLKKQSDGHWRLIESPRLNAGRWTLYGSANFNPGSLADGAGETTTVTVPGAVVGNQAEASFAADLQGITLTAWVSAANTVSVRFQNESGGTLDLASAVLRVRAFK